MVPLKGYKKASSRAKPLQREAGFTTDQAPNPAFVNSHLNRALGVFFKP